MNATDLCYLPASELAPLIASKQVSPVEVMTAILARVEKIEPQINALSVQDPALAMRRACDAEQAVMRGDTLGPLHGVPCTIKDLVWTTDYDTASASHTRAGFRAEVNTPFVDRLQAAGAVVFAKTTASEFGWSGISWSPLTGITHNPWRHGLNAGASSAGAGAACASGYGPLHQGGDGAGSIRMPAHFCGIYGLKPSYGRIPYYPEGTGDFTAHPGPMTRTVADAAMFLAATAGKHYLDHSTLEAPPADYVGRLRQGIGGARIAYSADLGHARVDPEVAALVRKAAERFASATGATVTEVSPEWGPLGPDLIRGIWPAHFSRMAKMFPDYESKMDPGLVACAREGQALTASDYLALKERKHAYVAAIHGFFQDWDFLITPSASVAAFGAGLTAPPDWPAHPWDWIQWAEFSYPFNMSWNPAASLPCGFTSGGLPVGMQIVGRRFDDLGVLQASAAFEAALPWADKRPPLDG
jgi:aspartyl-tRNA(Asn)/glutamyl-tRNA(Gln) amidotransferase subunit A